jgi:DnaJ-class molecular chaperone
MAKGGKTTPCPDCGGRKVIAVGTEDVKCATCDGKGTVKS